ncbi:MAG: CDP-glucose 4,6-dehydratase [Planctomycetaceae bacterium]
MLGRLQDCYAGRRVLVTGHTGFKGSWLCQWLLQLQAQVRGYALDPPTSPALFNDLRLATRMQDVRADIRDAGRLLQELREFEPEFVFHLAAQPLVRYSYQHPVETYETNVMGTVYLLDALRTLNRPCAVVVVTTDKCYENREWLYGYREEDPMGGSDPYSSSKGMAELAVAAWRRSFCQDGTIRLATARAGNVIGGGDWALDRIVPDCIRAIQSGRPIDVRHPFATRPWQHVLDPLNGYLSLGQRLDPRIDSLQLVEPFCGAFNFGPAAASNRPAQDVVEELFRHLPGSWRNLHTGPVVHEAAKLHLCVDKSHHLLNWQSKFDFTAAVRETAAWYRGYSDGLGSGALCQSSIDCLGEVE